MDKSTRNRLIYTLVSILILLTGCEKKPFSHIYDKSAVGEHISSIFIIHKNPDLSTHENIITQLLEIPMEENARYMLETDYGIYPKRCNNPLATAEQKSYIGFVKLTLFKEKKRIYTTQEDFKTIDKVDHVLEHLLDTMVAEMGI